MLSADVHIFYLLFRSALLGEPSCIIITSFAEPHKRNNDGNHIENLAEYAAAREIINIVHYPHRRNKAELGYAYRLSVVRPHSDRAAALCRKKNQRYPPFLPENKARENTREREARFYKHKISALSALFSERENDTAHYAENIEQHPRIGMQERKLERKRKSAPCLKKKIIPVLFALIGNQRTSRADISDKLYRSEKFCDKLGHKSKLTCLFYIYRAIIARKKPHGNSFSQKNRFFLKITLDKKGAL